MRIGRIIRYNFSGVRVGLAVATAYKQQTAYTN
jgi:hypothetical protein